MYLKYILILVRKNTISRKFEGILIASRTYVIVN